MITQLKAQPSVLQYSNSIVGEALLLDTWINNVSEALWHNLWTIFYQLLVYPVAAQPQPVIVETEQCAPDWEQHFNNSVHNGRNFLVQTYPIPTMDACPGTTTIKKNSESATAEAFNCKFMPLVTTIPTVLGTDTPLTYKLQSTYPGFWKRITTRLTWNWLLPHKCNW